MKKYISGLFSFFLFFNLSYSKPLFDGNKYFISCLSDGAKGVVLPSLGEYKLIYDPIPDGKTLGDTAYWYVNEVSPDIYTFQNVVSKKYIRHHAHADVLDRWALEMVDGLQADQSTSFRLDLHQTDNTCYYTIRSLVNTEKCWDRRMSVLTDAVTKVPISPVGVYNLGTATNQKFLFSDAQGHSVSDNLVVQNPTANSTQSLGVLANFMESITFAGKVPVAEKDKAELFLTVMEGEMDTNVSLKIAFKTKNSAHSLFIENKKVNDGDDFTFEKVSGMKTYTLEVRQNATVLTKATILFSCLPLVQLYIPFEPSGDYNPGSLVVTEPDVFTPSEVLRADLKVRGAWASGQPKKPYAIKLKDSDGKTALDRSFFGLRSDNNWILDAMYIDPARMRNRVSTDLWNDFSKKPYYADREPEMINGTRGHFVEVFLNDAYAGLYCMTEKVDRKQLNLKKLEPAVSGKAPVQHGALYKAKNWSLETQFGNEITHGSNKISDFNNYSEGWGGFNVKYPDMGDGEPIDWKPAYDAANLACPYFDRTHGSTDELFDAQVDTYFDLPVFVDYYLFIELLLTTDNHGKNYYLSVYDQKSSPMVSPAPWDLDGVWGRRWDGSANLTLPNQNFEEFLANVEQRQQNNLFLRLLELNSKGFNDLLKRRYEELRGSYFSYDALMNRFYRYSTLMQASGADAREQIRWGIVGIDVEVGFLEEWIDQRLNFLDLQYLGKPYVPTHTAATTSKKPVVTVYPNPTMDKLNLTNLQSGDCVQLLTIQGVILTQQVSTGNQMTFNLEHYSSGLYVVKVGECVVKFLKK